MHGESRHATILPDKNAVRLPARERPQRSAKHTNSQSPPEAG